MSKLYNKILITTDGSEYSINALKHALAIADSNDAELVVLSVVDDSFTIGLSNRDLIRATKNALFDKADANLNKIEELKNEIGADVKITLEKKEGSPADVILKTIESEDIDLVVIGSSGKSGFNKVIMGSVASKVANGAKCAVLIIK